MKPDRTRWQFFPPPTAKASPATCIPAHLPPEGRGPTVHLTVPDTLEAAVARVEPAGGKVLSPAIPIPVGRFVYITDPDGNSVGLFQYS